MPSPMIQRLRRWSMALGLGLLATPPGHGNWGPQLPVVYRWAYAYGVPGAPQDFIAQNAPPEAGGTE